MAAVTIDLDKSVLLQMAAFALLVVVLKPLLFDPVLKVFARREEQTEGARAKARRLQERAGELLREYESELSLVQQAAAEEREKLRVETARLEGEVLHQARDASNQILTEGRGRIEKEVQAIRFQLGRESERLAEQVVTKTLGREVSR